MRMKNKNGSKKTLILYVLKMLFLCSNEDTVIHATAMAKVLNSHGIDCDRKTIGRNIQYLIDFGLPIIKKNNGYYYDAKKDNFFKFLGEKCPY